MTLRLFRLLLPALCPPVLVACSSMELGRVFDARPPQVVYEQAVAEWAALRAELTVAHAAEASHGEWEALGEGLAQCRLELERAASLGFSHAAASLSELDKELSRYHELTRQIRGHYVKCRDCHGEGAVWQRASRRFDRPHEGQERSSCRRCGGRVLECSRRLGRRTDRHEPYSQSTSMRMELPCLSS